MKNRLLAMLLTLVMLIAAFSGATAAFAEEEIEYEDELHIGYKIEPATLDTQLITDAPPRVIAYGTIYEALVTLDANFKVREELCESYEISEDSREYTWYLRKGVKFHNGEEMTADDVVASMNRWLEHYGNARNMVGDAQFEKVDDYTVKISMENPTGLLNEMIATQTQGSVIMPKSVLDDLDPATGSVKEYIGTGPYKFGEWKEGSYIRLDRFEDYSPYGVEGEASGWWGYKTQLSEHIYYDFVADVSVRTAGIQTGEFDIVTEMNNDDYAMFQSIEGLNTYKGPQWPLLHCLQQGSGPLRGCEHAPGGQRHRQSPGDHDFCVGQSRLLPRGDQLDAGGDQQLVHRRRQGKRTPDGC